MKNFYMKIYHNIMKVSLHENFQIYGIHVHVPCMIHNVAHLYLSALHSKCMYGISVYTVHVAASILCPCGPESQVMFKCS